MNKKLNPKNFYLKKLIDINVDNLIMKKSSIIGLDIGNKTIGVSISDTRIKIASALSCILRKSEDYDCKTLVKIITPYNPGLIVFGWPVQMNGIAGIQCEKILCFIMTLATYINVDFAQWDERFSTSVVDNIMIQSNMSRKRRKKVIDKTAAVYILQGAIDLLNRNERYK